MSGAFLCIVWPKKITSRDRCCLLPQISSLTAVASTHLIINMLLLLLLLLLHPSAPRLTSSNLASSDEAPPRLRRRTFNVSCRQAQARHMHAGAHTHTHTHTHTCTHTHIYIYICLRVLKRTPFSSFHESLKEPQFRTRAKPLQK